jgi:hypothetical protein
VPGSAHAYGRPGGGARTKGRGLGASEADACTMLKEERAATLTQFLVTRLVMQGGKEADGTLVSQEVKETREFAVEAAGCRHNQREKGLVRDGVVCVYYCWINSKAMAEGRKRVAICAMKQERPQLVWLCVHPIH